MSSSSTRATINKKPEYASDSEKSKRLNANLIERRRMQNINSGFASLKKLLPPSDRKQTKAAILQQASQYILRLQRAVIQFKTDNDTLRSTLDAKNQTVKCAKHNSHSNPYPMHVSTKHYESKIPQGKPSELDLLLIAKPTVKALGSNNMDIQRSNYKRSVLPKPAHSKTETHSFGNNLRSFEHVKKLEPMVPQNSGFHNGLEVYHHVHAFDSSTLTPPISPALNERRTTHNSRDERSVTTSNTSPLSASNNDLIPHHASSSLPPKRNIFNSSTQTAVKLVRHDKRTRPYQKTDKEDMEKREVKRVRRQTHGDLQYILEAIDIIENKENQIYNQ